MNLLSHLAIGYIIAALLGWNFRDKVFWAIIFASVLPDADVFISNYITGRIRHRGRFHSLFMVPVLAFFSSLLWATTVTEFVYSMVVCSIAILFHLLADIVLPKIPDPIIEEVGPMDHTGVMLFWPIKRTRFVFVVSNRLYKWLNLSIFFIGIFIWSLNHPMIKRLIAMLSGNFG